MPQARRHWRSSSSLAEAAVPQPLFFKAHGSFSNPTYADGAGPPAPARRAPARLSLGRRPAAQTDHPVRRLLSDPPGADPMQPVENHIAAPLPQRRGIPIEQDMNASRPCHRKLPSQVKRGASAWDTNQTTGQVASQAASQAERPAEAALGTQKPHAKRRAGRCNPTPGCAVQEAPHAPIRAVASPRSDRGDIRCSAPAAPVMPRKHCAPAPTPDDTGPPTLYLLRTRSGAPGVARNSDH